MTDWIKCADSLPPATQDVLLVSKGIIFVGYRIGRMYNVASVDSESTILKAKDVTHWMELPDRPE